MQQWGLLYTACTTSPQTYNKPSNLQLARRMYVHITMVPHPPIISKWQLHVTEQYKATISSHLFATKNIDENTKKGTELTVIILMKLFDAFNYSDRDTKQDVSSSKLGTKFGDILLLSSTLFFIEANLQYVPSPLCMLSSLLYWKLILWLLTWYPSRTMSECVWVLVIKFYFINMSLMCYYFTLVWFYGVSQICNLIDVGK